jgi:hypothetical protein
VTPRLLREFPQPKSDFPDEWKSVRFLGGRTITKFGVFHKAAILVQTTNGLQLRFYGWRFTKKKRWWAQQKYYVSPGSVARIIGILDAFLLNAPHSAKEE